jgi:hypothetical protein
MGGNYTEIHHNKVVVLSVRNGDVNIETMNDLVMEGGKKVHLINEVGHKIEVESSALADDELINENKYFNYDIDVEWYLANGYSLAEDAFRWIESAI